MSELQDKLEGLKVKNNMNERYLKDAITSHEHTANGIIAEIDAIEKQIEDAEKPKLRHFDICKDHMGLLHVVIHRSDAPDCVAGPSILCDNTDPDKCGLTRVGNVQDQFDDLTAMQEDVTEFEVDGDKYELIDGCVVITYCDVCRPSDPDGFYYKADDMLKVANGLRQMHATLKRNNANPNF